MAETREINGPHREPILILFLQQSPTTVLSNSLNAQHRNVT